jgi:hypothetical protein
MHYSDQLLKDQVFNIVVYLHSGFHDDVEIQFTSIQECKYVHPEDLRKFIATFDANDTIQKELDGKKVENWYLMKLLLVGEQLTIYSVKNVSKSKDKFMRLH